MTTYDTSELPTSTELWYAFVYRRWRTTLWPRRWQENAFLCSQRLAMDWRMLTYEWMSRTSKMIQWILWCTADLCSAILRCRMVTDISIISCFIHVRYVVSWYQPLSLLSSKNGYQSQCSIVGCVRQCSGGYQCTGCPTSSTDTQCRSQQTHQN